MVSAEFFVLYLFLGTSKIFFEQVNYGHLLALGKYKIC